MSLHSRKWVERMLKLHAKKKEFPCQTQTGNIATTGSASQIPRPLGCPSYFKNICIFTAPLCIPSRVWCSSFTFRPRCVKSFLQLNWNTTLSPTWLWEQMWFSLNVQVTRGCNDMSLTLWSTYHYCRLNVPCIMVHHNPSAAQPVDITWLFYIHSADITHESSDTLNKAHCHYSNVASLGII